MQEFPQIFLTADIISDRPSSNNSIWTTPSLEDPLKLPENDDNILSLFNNNDRAKDLGFHSSDSEYISLDRLEDRNRSAVVRTTIFS